MGYTVLHAADLPWAERPAADGTQPRRVVDLTAAATLTQSRARLWQLPPGTRGPRHRELVQEEVFVVIAGTLTMLLGDPPERAELGQHSVVSVEAETALQVRNESEDDAVVLVYGAPPVAGQAEYLDDVEL